MSYFVSWIGRQLTSVKREDRVNRHGVKTATHIIHFVMEGIDEMIARKVVEKQEMLESLMDDLAEKPPPSPAIVKPKKVYRRVERSQAYLNALPKFKEDM